MILFLPISCIYYSFNYCNICKKMSFCVVTLCALSNKVVDSNVASWLLRMNLIRITLLSAPESLCEEELPVLPARPPLLPQEPRTASHPWFSGGLFPSAACCSGQHCPDSTAGSEGSYPAWQGCKPLWRLCCWWDKEDCCWWRGRAKAEWDPADYVRCLQSPGLNRGAHLQSMDKFCVSGSRE